MSIVLVVFLQFGGKRSVVAIVLGTEVTKGTDKTRPGTTRATSNLIAATRRPDAFDDLWRNKLAVRILF